MAGAQNLGAFEAFGASSGAALRGPRPVGAGEAENEAGVALRAVTVVGAWLNFQTSLNHLRLVAPCPHSCFERPLRRFWLLVPFALRWRPGLDWPAYFE